MDNIRVPWEGWNIVRRIGKGSYGTVYEIERALASFTEKAAMKVISIPQDYSEVEASYVEGYNDESISRLYSNQRDQILNEYKNMEELSGNSNIVSCKDVHVVSHENNIGWDVYIRMEFLTPLMTFLKDHNDLSSADICRLGIDICKALELCEKREIVHRDVKPENIFVTKDGTFKLGDFGIARTLDHITHATRVGTERYMAPEVIKREPYGKDVDLYSLGLVLYWLLNNKRMPFLNPEKVPVGDEPNLAQNRRLAGETLPRPAGGSEELQNIVLKACEFDREKRYASAKEMLQALKFVSENNEKASPVKAEPVVPAPESNPPQIMLETQTDSWEEVKTLGKSFLDDNKDPEVDDAEQNTLTSDWKNIKIEQKNHKEEFGSREQTASVTETDALSPNDEPIHVYKASSEPKKFPIPLNILICGFLIIVGIAVLAIYLVHNEGVSSSSGSSSDSSLSSSSNSSSNSSYDLSYFSGVESYETVTFAGIEWILLAEEGEKTLLLSKECIDYRVYNKEDEAVTWETCSLRSYLNGTWYEDTFSEGEKNKILTTYVENPNNGKYGTRGGNDTKDKVFLLSIDEAEDYFSTDRERVAGYNGIAVDWWLRSPGDFTNTAASVDDDGYVDYSGSVLSSNGSFVCREDVGVRPALWVNLNS